ncbi:MAG: hypothetical protein CVU89_00015 [Firmicutes bacterium HGW-Firmicutes-14]|nr:MAG: hypothetical protein CVU89_00015 [Firmicutes bacterium HGW-Firmicutes-14]
MKKLLYKFLGPETQRSISSSHRVQRNLYGVYEPPSLKQLISLRHLLIRTGSLKEVTCEELLGLSKSECKELLKELNSIYISQRRKKQRTGEWNEVESVEKVSR